MSLHSVHRRILVCCSAALAFAVNEGARAQDLQLGEWRSYTSMRAVRDIAVSPDSNHVWVATSGGAYRAALDGNQRDDIELRNTDGLLENDLTAIACDQNGNVYIGGVSGSFDIYSETTAKVQRLTDIAKKEELTNKTIGAIRIFGDRVYLCTGYGLTVFNRRLGQFAETITRFGALPDQEAVHDVAELNGSTFAVLPDSILVTSSNNLSGTWSAIRGTIGSPHSLTIFRGRLYAGSDSGLFLLDPSAGLFSRVNLSAKYSIGHLGTSEAMDSILIMDVAGTTLLASEDALVFQVRGVPGTGGLTSGSSFAVSRGGTRLYGTSQAGVVIESRGKPLDTKVFPPGPISNNSNSVVFAPSTSRLYSANLSDGVSVFSPDSNSWRTIAPEDNILPQDEYRKIFYDSIRAVTWISAKGSGLYKVGGIETPNPQVTHFGSPPLPGTVSDSGFVTVGEGILDHNGDFVVSTWAFNGKGLSRTSDGQTITNLQIENWRPYGNIAEDPDHNLWIGTEAQGVPASYGVFFIRPDGSTGGLPGGTVLPRPEVNALIVDQDDGLWCGTNAGVRIISNISDVNLFSSPTFIGRDVPILQQQVIRSIAVDGVNNKWVGTDNGVFVVSPDGSDSLAHFSKENSPLIDNNTRGIAIDLKRGEAYIATLSGISRVSTIFREGKADYSGIYVYPNPVVQSSESMPKVYIAGLVGASTVKIYTVSGRLVATIDGSQLGSTVTWDGREETGRMLPSGVYLVSASSTQTSEAGESKFVVIRKP